MKTLKIAILFSSTLALALACRKEKAPEPLEQQTSKDSTITLVGDIFVETGSLESLSPSEPVPVLVKAFFKDLPENWQESYEIIFERSINGGPYSKVPSNLAGSCYKSGDTIVMIKNFLFTPNLEASYSYNIYATHRLDSERNERTKTKEVKFSTSNSWLTLKTRQYGGEKYFDLFQEENNLYTYDLVFLWSSSKTSFQANSIRLINIDSATFYSITTPEQLNNYIFESNKYRSSINVSPGQYFTFTTTTLGDPEFPTRRERKAIAHLKSARIFDSGYQAYCDIVIKYLY